VTHDEEVCIKVDKAEDLKIRSERSMSECGVK
jgi:hypothetical protein